MTIGFIGGAELQWGFYYNITKSDLSKVFDINAQDTAPQGLAWNDDGSKLYMIGASNVNIYSYTLSTNFDISTATFNQSFDVSGQDSLPLGLAWNDTGSKLYIIGDSNDNIYSYTLSTNFDISTATFNQSFDVSGQDTDATGLAWNNDGSKVYITGSGNNNIYSYTLSTNFDISTATFNQSLDVSGQDLAPADLAWNDNGSRLYMIGINDDNIYSYTLSTNFDISTATFNQSLDVSGQDTNTRDLTWDKDGSKLFTSGSDNNSIYEYVVGKVVPK